MLNLTPLFSSSKGNCTYVSSSTTKLLVDAGVSCKRLVDALVQIDVKPEEIQAILVTHEHSDHIKGIKIFASKYNIPVFASTGTWKGLPSQSLSESQINKFSAGDAFTIGDITTASFSIPHDAYEPCGFTFTCNDEKVTVATDLGHITQDLLSCMESSNAILLESNHDVDMLRSGPYPYYLKQRIIGNNGHLSNAVSAETVEYLIKKGTKKFILGHLSQENNFPELALETIKSRLKLENVDFSGVSIEVAHP